MRPDAESRLGAVQRELFMRSMAIGALSSAARQLGNAMREVFFEAGSVIYELGSPADDVYFIVSGSVKLVRDGAPAWELGPRSVVGGMDADLDRPRSRTAVALTDVEALVLRNDDRLEVLEDNFEQTRRLILFVGERLHQLTLALPSGGFGDPAEPGPEPEAEPLPLVERVLSLRDVPAFSKASIQALVTLAPAAEELRIDAGQTLFRSGEVRGVFFVIARGLIELERSQPPGKARFGPASIVGGSSAFGDMERFYTARAVRASVLLRIREDDFFDVMEDHFDLARSVMAYMSAQREQVMDQLERLKTEARP
jgi:CRP-like cAMP-binding protein